MAVMDQRPDVRASDGWRDPISDSQAERAQLRDQLGKLHKMIDRLHALGPQYQKVLTDARKSIQKIHILEREANGTQQQTLLPELDAHSFTLEKQQLITLPENTTLPAPVPKISTENTSIPE
jgi:hypothetical protein